jgi:hypothetical protein
MTSGQEQLVSIYGILSAAVLGLVGAVFAYRIFRLFQKLFSASYKPDGSDQGINFSDVRTISSYIPQVKSEQFTYPLLAVNVDYVGQSIFDWSDPARSHSYYDLTRDVEQLLKGDENEETCYKAFGQIRHWPPNGGDAVEEGGKPGPKSSLRRGNEAPYKRNVSWSSKVTCKTYSKDVPMSRESFDAGASTNQGMNFDGHAEPIYDPHTQNEARGFGRQQEEGAPPQAPPSNHLNQYANSGVDEANQQSDPFYGDSQQQQQQQQQGYDQPSENSLQTGSSSTSSAYTDNSEESGSGYSEEDDYGGSFSEESQTTGGSEDPRQIT